MESLNYSALISEAKHQEWQENLPALYDFFIKETLTSPSLTVQWLPSPEKRRRGRTPKRIGKMTLKQRLVLGSNNTGEDNYLSIATISFSEKRLKTHFESMQRKQNTASCFIKMEAKIKHPGVVNRARYMPQNPAVLASKSSNGDVYIYDVRKIFSASKRKGTYDPGLKLKGLTAGGNGLSWNPNRKGYIVSCSINERTIRLWDINSKSIKNVNDNSLSKFHRGHPSGVKDCSWHCLHSSLFGSSGNDKNINIWDIRADFTKMPAITGIGHKSSVNCLSFNNFSDHLFASGSSDQTIAVWDLRKMKSPCHRMSWQKTEICQLHWSPNNESILASSGVDEKVLVWDISEIGAPQTPDEAKEAPPELLFIHGGHSDNILDFSWNLTEPWLLSSVSQDNVIQIWQMGDHIYDDNISKKSSRLESSKPKDSLKDLAIPGSSKSNTCSVEVEPANIMESPKSPKSSFPLGPTTSTTCPSPKSQQSTMETCESEEASAIPGPSKALDFESLFPFPDSPLINSFPFIDELEMLLKPLPCLSPLSELSFENSPETSAPQEFPQVSISIELPKSAVPPISKSPLEDSPQSVESPELPKVPTSMESPKSLELPSTPESLDLSTSDTPTPPESTKAILLPYLPPKNTENPDNQDKHGVEEHSDFSKSLSVIRPPEYQSCIPAPYEFSTSFTDGTIELPETLMLPYTSLWYKCQGYKHSPTCRICYYLKKINEADKSYSYNCESPPMSFSPPHSFSPETQNLADGCQYEYEKTSNPSIDSNDSIITNCLKSEGSVGTQDFKTPSDDVLTSDSQEHAENPLHLDGTTFEMHPEIHQSGDMEPLDSHEISNMKIIKDVRDYLEEILFLNFLTPPGSPASQQMMTTEDVSVHSKETPIIQESQDEPASTINNPDILTVPGFHDITVSPSTTNILCSEDRAQSPDSSASSDVYVNI